MKCVGLLVVSSDTVVIILGTKTEKQWTGVRTHGFQQAHCCPGMFLSGNHPGPLQPWTVKVGVGCTRKQVKMTAPESALEPTTGDSLSPQRISSMNWLCSLYSDLHKGSHGFPWAV